MSAVARVSDPTAPAAGTGPAEPASPTSVPPTAARPHPAPTGEESAAHVRCTGLRFRYPGASDDALRGVDIDAPPGTITALVGPSGCGKTTLLKLVGGLLDPSAGTIHVDDVDATTVPLTRRRVGWVPQQYALFEHLDVTGNVAFGLRAQKVPAARRAERVRAMLELCRISELANRPVADLSGGQRQRVAIARALAPYPRILLLDEPLAALDPQLRVQLRSELAALIRDAGVTTLIVTHDQDEALALADQLVLVRDGSVVQSGASAHLWAHPATAWAAQFLGHAVVVPGRLVAAGEVELAPGLVVIAHDAGAGIGNGPVTGPDGGHGESGDAAPVGMGVPVRVALRGGDLVAYQAGEGSTGAVGVVVAAEFAGERYRLEVRLDGGLTVPAHADGAVAPGAVVLVAPVPGRSVPVVTG